jgi:adenylosuccinate lyase
MQPISPLDGRYARSVEALRQFFSEDALIRARALVEIRYFIALSHEKAIEELPTLSAAEEKALEKIYREFTPADADEVRSIEKTTNHDVKAVEYFLQKKMRSALGSKAKTEFLHFALTSEDVNNLAYGVLIHAALQQEIVPLLEGMTDGIAALADDEHATSLLSLTHGQPATPTTLGKEMQVFVDRLERQLQKLRLFTMQGKFGGAVGNYLAHRSAYPAVDWTLFGQDFVSSLGLEPLAHATQINPHDDLAELSHLFVRINTILIDLSRDLWAYISRGVFRQRVIKGEVGSSTMPHKVNPIDFENAEGNLGVSSALFDHFAHKLPISRLQRDLSDSTVQRNIGVAFGHHVLAIRSLTKGLSKLSVDHACLKAELDAHPEVYTEAIQTVMRRFGIKDAYEQMKALSRGRAVTRQDLRSFVKKLAIPAVDIKRLLSMLA